MFRGCAAECAGSAGQGISLTAATSRALAATMKPIRHQVRRVSSAANSALSPPTATSSSWRVTGSPTLFEHFDQGDDHAALGDQSAVHPLQEVGLDRGDLSPDCLDIGLGREIGVEQGDLLFGENLGLTFGEAMLGQSLDIAMGIERDGFGHEGTIGTTQAPDKGRRADRRAGSGGPGERRRPRFRQILALMLSLLATLAAPGPATAQDAASPASPSGVPPALTDPPPALGSPERPETPAVPPGPLDEPPSPAAADNEAAPSAAGEPGRQVGGEEPAAADEPGRQADPPPAASATSPAGPPEWFWRDAEIAQAFECPIGPIAVMLEAAQGQSEFSPALEVEREVLVLCRDRWAVLKDLVDAELSLAAVLRASAAAREQEELKLAAAREREALALEEQRRLAQARIEGARQGALEAARAARAREEAAAAAAAAPKVEPETVIVKEPEPAPEERYGWFAMKGSGTDLRAGVTDGEGRWWVRVGDGLPGGVRIGAIRARPPRVVVAGGAAAGLPYRPGGR